MIAHDRHKLTMVNFSEYEQVSGLLIGDHLRYLMTGLLNSHSENLANV